MAETILKDKDSFSEEAREKIQLWYSEKKSANEDGVH
jgi:ATP-dependent DNA helicase RecG